MEKRVIKKDALAGIIKNMAESTVVYAPVRDEDNVLFKVLEKGMEPLLAFDNTKNAPKNFFFPQTEVMMRYMRTERGKELSTVEEAAQEAVLFGVRPCDARSFVLLDNVFNDPKYKDPYYIERREKDHRRFTGLCPSPLHHLLLHLCGRASLLFRRFRCMPDRHGGYLSRRVRNPEG